ncbi:NUDIX domain-containing protein [Nannocystaceae bacterium ST9]
MTQQPEIIVACAALCERAGRLLVMKAVGNDPSEGAANARGERRSCGQEVLNQPVGRLCLGEDVVEAVVRIVREQTGLEVRPEQLIGPYCWMMTNGHTIIRYNFVCSVDPNVEPAATDPETTPLWMDADELQAQRGLFRNPATRRAFDDYFAGRLRPLAETTIFACWD